MRMARRDPGFKHFKYGQLVCTVRLTLLCLKFNVTADGLWIVTSCGFECLNTLDA